MKYIIYEFNPLSKDIVVFVHGGPGYPQGILYSVFFQTLCKELNLNKLYTWEQKWSGGDISIHKLFMNWSIEVFVDELNLVCQHVKKSMPDCNLILFAHSWGTIVASYFLEQNKGDIYKYVGISPIINGEIGELYSIKSISKGSSSLRLKTISYLYKCNTKITNLLYLYLQRSRIVQPMCKYSPIEFNALLYKINFYISIYKLWPICRKFIIRKFSYFNDVDTLFIFGKKDNITPPSICDEIELKDQQRLNIIIIDKCYHRPHLENPKAFVKIVNRFLGNPEQVFEEH